MSDALRIGVLGGSGFARRRLLPSLVAAPDLRLVAVASRSAAKAQEFATAFGCDGVVGYDALLARPDLDAIIVALPPSMHEAWAIRCLDSGRHVFCEKPLAPTAAAVERMVEASRRADRVLLEDFAFLHHAQYARLRALLAAGAVGDLRLVRATFSFPPLPAADIRYDPALAGGALLDAGCYTLLAARRLLGDPVTLRGGSLTVSPQHGVDVLGAATLAGPGGVVAQVGFGFDLFYQCELQVLGTTGRLTLPRVFTAPASMVTTLTLETADGARAITVEPCDHFAAILADFARRVREGRVTDNHDDLRRQGELLDAVRAGCLR